MGALTLCPAHTPGSLFPHLSPICPSPGVDLGSWGKFWAVYSHFSAAQLGPEGLLGGGSRVPLSQSPEPPQHFLLLSASSRFTRAALLPAGHSPLVRPVSPLTKAPFSAALPMRGAGSQHKDGVFTPLEPHCEALASSSLGPGTVTLESE